MNFEKTHKPNTPSEFFDKYLKDVPLNREWVEWALDMYAEHCIIFRDFHNAQKVVEIILKSLENSEINDNVKIRCDICTFENSNQSVCENCGYKLT